MKPLTEVVRFDDGERYYEPSSLIVSPVTVNAAPDGLIAIIGHTPELRVMKEIVDSDDDVRRYSGVVASALGAAFLRGQEFAEMLDIAHSYAAVPMALYNMFLEQLARTYDAADMRLPDNIVDFIQPGGFSKNGWIPVKHGGGTLFLIPIYYGGRARGILTVQSDSPALSEKKRAVLGVLSQYLASVWLKKAAVNEYNNNLKNEILTGILSGDDDSALLPKLRTLGIEKKGQFFVILMMIPETENHLSYCGTQDGAALLNTLENMINTAGLKGIVIPEYNDNKEKFSRSKVFLTNPSAYMVLGGREGNLREALVSLAFKTRGAKIFSSPKEESGDFIIIREDGKPITIEVGGKKKKFKESDYVIRDNIEYPASNVIPLYLIAMMW